MIQNLYNILDILGILGGIFATGIGAAYAAFKLFGEKWLEVRFKKEISKFNHEQNKEVEELKNSLGSVLNGKTLLQEKEFESLEIIWKSLTAYEISLTNLYSFSLSPSTSAKVNAKTLFSTYKQYSFSEQEANYVDSFSGSKKINELRRLVWIKFLGSFILEEGNFRKTLASLGIFLDQSLYDEIVIFQSKLSKLGNTSIHLGPLEKGAEKNEHHTKYLSEIIPELISLRGKVRTRLENCL